MNKSIFLLVTLFALASAAHAETQPLTIEERLSRLEAQTSTPPTATASAGPDGFFIRSTDGNFSMRIGGVIQMDYRDFLNDHGATAISDQFLMRRVRPTIEGTINKYVGFRITPDFANGGGTNGGSLLQDAYIDFSYVKFARVRLGKIKSPVGFENIQTDTTMFFNERSLANQLISSRDAGLQISGTFRSDRILYQVAVLDGQPDATAGETDSGDGKDYAGRLFLQPFKLSPSEWLNGLGVGIAGGLGNQFGSASSSGLTPGYRTDGQQVFFSYQSGSFADGQRRRIEPQAYWYFSHVGLMGQYITSSQDVKRVSTSTASANIEQTAWQVEGSIVLTGERPSFTGVKPRRPFDPQKKTWGAFEIVGRYSNFRADTDAFSQGFASIATSARRAKSWSTGLNWYLSTNTRINSDYAVTSFSGGAAGGQNRQTEKVILNRVQLTF